eukprot:c28099_g1_i1 orf=385-1548(-)
MEVRESSGPRPPNPTMQSGPAVSFGAYYHRGGAAFPANSSFMSVPPSGIHAPAALRYIPTQTIAISANPNAFTSFHSEGPRTSVATPISASPSSGMGMAMVMGTGMAGLRTEPVKRKRGRPRKYGTEVNGVGNVALGLAPLSSSLGSPREKRGRGYGRKAQMTALGAAGQGFTPHVITIAAGEDVSMKIMSFLQHAPWVVCILSANGAISNVTLRQPSISGGIVTYEGRYEILSLTGSFLLTESGGTRSRVGGLSISLAGADGRVIGGAVAGLLTAASPVQVVVGTFFPESRKNQVRTGVADSQHSISPAGMAAGTSPSIPMVPVCQPDAVGPMHVHDFGTIARDSHQQSHVSQVMPLQSVEWTGTHFDVETRGDTDTVPSSPGGSY